MQLIENVSVREGEDADKVLWEREKNWQAQLFTLSHGLNNMNERQFLIVLFTTIICHKSYIH